MNEKHHHAKGSQGQRTATAVAHDHVWHPAAEKSSDLDYKNTLLVEINLHE